MEPVDTFAKHYQTDNYELIHAAQSVWTEYKEAIDKLHTSKDRYFALKDQAVQNEVEIEEGMLAMERGKISIEKVQRVSNKAIKVKYKAEVALQTYTSSITHLNRVS